MKRLKTSVRRLLCSSTANGANAAMTLGLILAICPTSAFPETQIRGTPQAVRVEAKNASIQEILLALNKSFGLQYHSTVNLQKKITGSYAGSLDRVLVRLLAGNDFVLKTTDGRIEVSLLSHSHATTHDADAPAAVPLPSVVADGLGSVPAGTKGSAVPTAGSTTRSVPPPTGTSNSSQVPNAKPNAIAPPTPIPPKSNETR